MTTRSDSIYKKSKTYLNDYYKSHFSTKGGMRKVVYENNGYVLMSD